MPRVTEVQSALVADCGSVFTKVALLDFIEGEYRFVARSEVPTTAASPFNDVMTGLNQAIGEIEFTTGRRLFQDGQLITPERDDGSGVDAFVATTSAAGALHVVVVGATRDLSAAAGIRAVRSTYAEIQDVMAADSSNLRRWSEAEDKVALFHRMQPEAILLTGGVDDGSARHLVEVCGILATAIAGVRSPTKPPLIYAGNTAGRQIVAELLGGLVDLRVVDNVLPAFGHENLLPAQTEISELYRQRRMARLPGFGQLSAWSQMPVLPSSDALGLVARFLARQYGADVLSVDVGGDATSLFSVIEGRFRPVVRSGLGVGTGALGVWQQAGHGAITRWLPYELSTTDLHNYVENKRLRPITIPQTREDVLLELALVREALRLVVAETGLHDMRPKILIASGGGLVHAAHYGQTTLVLLDALQPVGVSRLWLDNLLLLPQMGALATLEPMAAGQVAVRDALLPLGTLICPVSRSGSGGRAGKSALRFRIVYAQGGSLDVEVPYGSLEVIPLPLGQQATLDLHPARGFDIGLGPGRAGKIDVDGGVVGLVVDARGRPLALPTDGVERRQKIQEWLLAVGG
jgi:hypothetical protein